MSYHSTAQNYGRPQQQGVYQQQQHANQAQYGNHGAYLAHNTPPQGYSPAQPARQGRPAPPGADHQLWYWFTNVDIDGSGSLTTEELQRALINGDWTPFNIETVRLMMNMFDTDNSGTISFQEFAGLWKYIEEWKKCFATFDADQSGTIDKTELRTALRSFGYNLSDSFINLLIVKYDRLGHRPPKTGRGTITFDNFVQSCVTVKTLTDSFRRFDTDADGWIQISYEQFLELVVMNR